MPKGHRPDCNCVVCRRTRATVGFTRGQQVVTTKQVRALGRVVIPAETCSTVQGFSGGKLKIEFQKNFVWVEPGDIRAR